MDTSPGGDYYTSPSSPTSSSRNWTEDMEGGGPGGGSWPAFRLGLPRLGLRIPTGTARAPESRESAWSHGASSWGGAPARPRSESWQGSGKEAFLPPAGERARKLPAFMSLAGRVLAAGCPGGCLGASPAPQEVTAQGGCWGWKPSCLFWSRGQESDCWARRVRLRMGGCQGCHSWTRRFPTAPIIPASWVRAPFVLVQPRASGTSLCSCLSPPHCHPQSPSIKPHPLVMP